MSAATAQKPALSLPKGPKADVDEAPVKPLKPEALDKLAREYIDIQAELLQEQLAVTAKMKQKAERMGVLAKQFVEVCDAHGSPHEKKSKLLSGLEYEVMTTVSTSSSLDQAAIAVFQGKCEKAEKQPLFDELFEKVSEYRMRPGAGEVVRRSMGEMMTGRLAASYLKCSVGKTSPPRLAAVRPRQRDAVPTG